MVKVEGLSIDYKMMKDKVKSVKEYVVKLVRRSIRYEHFRALNDVSFEVGRGEVMGIIGRNGAGKSTLLKAISGILRPTEGKVTLLGNVVPMLELGSGFDYDLSGKENIFLNGAVLGYSEKFLKDKYDEILAFSELEDFIDIPIRNYSSGMVMRLAFSVASLVNPQILIVDEILAVGDAAFQEKSKAKMLELMSGGTTVLFTSHNTEQIKAMCDRVLWLEHGNVMAIGDPDEVCGKYEEFMNISGSNKAER